MPQVYRRHSEYSPRPSLVPRRRSSMMPSGGPQPTDADDSIVLADLVRSGEASRLRRRGAIRIEHATATTRVPPPLVGGNAGPSSYAPPARPIIIEPSRTLSRTPSTEPDAEGVGADEYTYTSGPAWREWDSVAGRGQGPSGRGTDGVQAVEIISEGAQAGQAYTLYCGGEDVEMVEEEGPLRRYEPSPLPGFPSSSTPSSARAQGKAPRRMNGCGVVVHVRTYPQRPRGVWMAKEDAPETVVALDPAYCDHLGMDKMLKSACGCIREGIGCSVCGNILGTRYIPCQAASESIFCPTPTSPSGPSPSSSHRPSGPGYWNARPTSSHRRPPPLMLPRITPSSYYTFFADRVTASPAHDAPPRSIAAPTLVEPRRGGSRPVSPEIDYGYRWTASPQPATAELPVSSGSNVTPNPPLSPVFAIPSLPTVRRNSSQLRPAPTSARESVLGLQIQLPLADTSGPQLDADGVPVGEMDEPNSPDKEGMSWPSR